MTIVVQHLIIQGYFVCGFLTGDAENKNLPEAEGILSVRTCYAKSLAWCLKN